MGAFRPWHWPPRDTPSRSPPPPSSPGDGQRPFRGPALRYIQQRSDSREKGRVVAANNFYQTIGMLIASAVMWLSLHPPAFRRRRHHVRLRRLHAPGHALHRHRGPRITWFASRSGCSPTASSASASTARKTCRSKDRPCWWPNHMSHVDGLLVAPACSASSASWCGSPSSRCPHFTWLLRRANAIPVGTDRPRDAVGIHPRRRAPRTCRRPHGLHLRRGRHLPPPGNMLPFKRGLEKIVQGTGRAHHSGAPGSPWGKHLQLRRRQVFLEMAHPDSLPRDRQLRRAARFR